MKAVNLIIESALPEELRDYNRVYNKSTVGQLLSDIAVSYPDEYDRISKHIADVGRKASYRQGETIGLEDMKPLFDKGPYMEAMAKEIAGLDRSSPDFENAREEIWAKYNDILMEDTKTFGRQSSNAIADSILSGARGKDAQLKMMVTTPGLFADHFGSAVPIFVERSFGQGVSPAEFLASTYGARTAVVSTKKATAKGGDFAKQLVQASIPLIVTMDDCTTGNGIDLPLEDKSIKNRVLAVDAGGLKAGTLLDRAAMRTLEKAKVKNVVVRSPMTCQAHKGLCSKCIGKMYDNKFSKIGDSIGTLAAQAISEPITQMALNVKHTGGAAKTKGKSYAGFEVLNQLAQSPEAFPHRAPVSTVAGTVKNIEAAPQGGNYIYVGEERYYAPEGYEPLVQKGQSVEKGAQLSDGIVDVRDVIAQRGLGSGRRYFAKRLHQALDESGVGNDRRNVEIAARAVVDHVEVEDDDNLPGRLPGDMVSYNRIAQEYAPPTDTKEYDPQAAVGKYLQQPVLHYSIGTQLTPRQAKRISAAGYKTVMASNETPAITPTYQRLRTSNRNNDDWLGRMFGSYLKDSLQEAAVRGQETDTASNIHFVPRLAKGEGFGKNIERTGEF